MSARDSLGVEPIVTTWRIWIRGGDATDLDEQMTLLSTAGHVYWFDGGVVIQTEPTGLGDYYAERVVPWSQVIDYRMERSHG